VDEAKRIHLIILIGGTAALVPPYELSESKTSFEVTFREPWNSSKTFPARDKGIWATLHTGCEKHPSAALRLISLFFL